ncbi:hypothetical protein BXZ70DRAFT_895483 [Cristinia sonorae]|uniref:SNF5-domain-containing protein n=1 Tax=Cristinia sonorae TaxID=1940300 RepID=A0A8K0UN71_9AGAR|nr:hypothetical protein BXZ70DRAFT_895483 [Cristinia sonorae]
MSAGAYPPLAPTPSIATSAPGSPSSMRGVKRKVSETPQPPTTPGQQQQHGQFGRSGSLPPQQPQVPTQHQNQMKVPGMNVSMPMNTQQQPMMGGTGGGSMGPPPFLRSGSQGPMDLSGMGMNIGGPAGMNMNMMGGPQGLSRQPSSGAVPGPPLLNTNIPPSTSAPGTLGATPSAQGQMFPTPAQALMSATTTTPTSLVSAANGITPSTTAAAPQATGPPTIVPALPPLPANVSLNPKTTRITVVPLIDSTKLIPELSSEDIENVKGWMKKDKEYEGVYRKMKERMVEELRDTVVKNRGWWEKGGGSETMNMSIDGRRRVSEKFGVTGFKTGRDDRRRKTGRREGFKLPRLSEKDALVPEQLVPIRLEFDVEHHKMRDTFVWNLNDPIITPDVFAQSIVDDYALAPSYHAIITKAIQDQLSDYKAHSAIFGGEPDASFSDENGNAADVVVKGEIEEEEDAKWWDAWRKNVRSNKGGYVKKEGQSRKRRKVVKDESADTEDVLMGPPPVPVRLDDPEEDESKMQEEMRILVKLDIIVGSVKLEDQLEWDLENTDPSPERFAEVYANELGLAGEFKTAIAHCIREQVQLFQKSLFLVGHPSDGSVLQDDDLRMSLLPSLSTGARSMDQVGAFTPLLNYLSESEIERNEREREKELNRRRRKTTRVRRGVVLPDRDPPKTLRTPAIGFPEIDAATLALVNAAAAPTSRRAAAAAASVNIANIIASDNGTMVIPAAVPAAPIQPVVPAPKEKKLKGHFKAPSYPSSVLRPRAQVKAPTSSTAADASTLMPPIEGDLPAPTSNANPENRGARVVLTSKRARELEREAKEKEYADGQHANYIDGVWHCSNCGCPESIAIGRRKGPLGDKSQCGTCGKFWHRHRRPRPVTYNSDLAYHQNLKDQEEQAKVAASRKKRPQPAHADPPSSKAPTVEPETPKPKSDIWMEVNSPSKNVNNGIEEPERAVSPASSTSSASEPPLAQQRVKANGVSNHTAKSAPPAGDVEMSSSSKSTADESPSSAPPTVTASTPATTAATATASAATRPPPTSSVCDTRATTDFDEIAGSHHHIPPSPPTESTTVVKRRHGRYAGQVPRR